MSRPLANVGAPEIPWSGDLQRYEFDQWLYNTVRSLQDTMIQPGTPTNVRATALAGAIQVDFTRSDGAGYVLYWNTTPSINMAVRIELGGANKYVDDIGAGSVKRYYAVRAKSGNIEGAVSAWVSATSLALGTAITPPTPPPDTETPFFDDETESIAVQRSNKGSYSPL